MVPLGTAAMILPPGCAGTSRADFVIYIRAKCPNERQQFKVAFVDYLALRHPELAMNMHFSAFEDVAKAAIDDVASAYIDLTK
jgi:hypothetical protein